MTDRAQTPKIIHPQDVERRSPDFTITRQRSYEVTRRTTLAEVDLETGDTLPLPGDESDGGDFEIIQASIEATKDGSNTQVASVVAIQYTCIQSATRESGGANNAWREWKGHRDVLVKRHGDGENYIQYTITFIGVQDDEHSQQPETGMTYAALVKADGQTGDTVADLGQSGSPKPIIISSTYRDNITPNKNMLQAVFRGYYTT